MMSGLCRRTPLFPLILIVLTTPARGQNDLGLLFRTTNDEYISFEGGDIPIVCSHSSSLQDIIISLYYDSGESISATVISSRIVTATLRSVSNSPTVFCNVSGDVQESAKLTVKTIPRDLSPYCSSNYNDGIIANAALKLSCYVDTQNPVGFNEQWRENSDTVLQSEERINIFDNTRRISSTVFGDPAKNGTNYTCVEVRNGIVSASCQVGPIFVYENVLTVIEFPDMSNISHGDTREFRCSSIPSSNISWIVLTPSNDAGIVVNINGPVITVNVPKNVSFVGNFEALCVGTLNDARGEALLDIYITARVEASTLSGTTPTTVSEQAESESLIIYIICGAILGVVVIIVIVLFTLWLCRRIKQKGYTSNTTQPVEPQKQENTEPEYAVPPIGMTTIDDMVNSVEYTAERSDDNGDPDHYETESVLYTAVNKETKEQSKGNGDVLVPSPGKAYPKPYTQVDKNDNGEFNVPSGTDARVPVGDGSVKVAEPPPYAMVDKNRHVVIDEGFLDDDNDVIDGDYSEYQSLS